jgi:hypothetical protein
MNKLIWWLRIVGALYLLLGVMGLLYVLLSPQASAASMVPPSYSADEVTVRALNNQFLPTVLGWLVLGVMMLYGSREPARARILVLLVALLELFVWVTSDIVWLVNGLPAVAGIPFLVLHTIIGVTGIVFLRQTAAQASQPA